MKQIESKILSVKLQVLVRVAKNAGNTCAANGSLDVATGSGGFRDEMPAEFDISEVSTPAEFRHRYQWAGSKHRMGTFLHSPVLHVESVFTL